ANPWNDSIQNTTTTNNTSYLTGELVYMATGADTGDVFVSLSTGNQNEPDVVDAFSLTTMYQAGAVVSQGGVNYQSLVNLNYGNLPPNASFWTTTLTSAAASGSWIELLGATIAQSNILYPVGSGPANNTFTRNVFRKPAGFLREAPQDPKSGALAWQG